ncbi:uncharacterized protein LOC110887787 [Helianthus annuus]|uniref:uncharacterized protein LOC110887787 n=1 Tax=Helianthus annuus TaxID=4232 RepID=UPI000B8F205F|nr:uncharacterized protein LOC110887787 [Helianthus annuus]
MSISIDSNNLSFVNDFNPGKDMWNMKVRIIRKWNQGYKMDLIFIDEKGAKIQAEDAVVILSKFGVGENKDLYKVAVQPYKINFYRCTTVTPASDWQCVKYGFNFRAYEDILQGEALNALSMLLDLWFVVEILKSLIDLQRRLRRSISILKTWSEYTVQSDKFATRIFLNEEIDEVNELRRSLILKFGQGSGSTSQTILSSQNVFPLHKEFVTDGVKKHVDEISEIEKEMSCVVVATIKIVQEEYSWFYAACRKCFKKVMGKSEYLQNVENVSDDIVRLPVTSLVCPKCHSECTSITTKFKVQVQVHDESGSVSFVMFDRDVQKLLGLAASDIRERQSSILKMTIVFILCKKTCDDLVIIAELVGRDGNGDENTEEVTQEVADVKDVNLSKSSQVSAE